MTTKALALRIGLLALTAGLTHAAPPGAAFTSPAWPDDGGPPANCGHQMNRELCTHRSDGTVLGPGRLAFVVFNGRFAVDLEFGPLPPPARR